MEVILWLAFVAVGFHLGYAAASLNACDVVAEVSGGVAILAVVAAVVVVVV